MAKKNKGLAKYILKKDTTFDKIFANYIDPDLHPLTKKQEDQKTRYEEAFCLLLDAKTERQTRDILTKKHGVNPTTAWRWIKDAIRLFGDINKARKEGYREIVWSYQMEVFQLAKEDGDLEAMNRAIANMIKIRGLDKEDPDIPDFSKLEGHEYKIQLDKAVKQTLLKAIEKGAVNFDEVMPVEDVEHEEVKE